MVDETTGIGEAGVGKEMGETEETGLNKDGVMMGIVGKTKREAKRPDELFFEMKELGSMGERGEEPSRWMNGIPYIILGMRTERTS